MAAPVILIKLSKDLAYKLQDPVTTGTANGQRLTADARLGYLIRAYRRLSRMVMILYPSLISKLFHKYYTIIESISDDKGLVDFTAVQSVHDVYTREPGALDWDNTDYWSPIDFLDVKMGINKFYKPDANAGRVYWTIIDDMIHLIPEMKFEVTYSGNRDIASILESGGYTSTIDIDIPPEHTDILLSLAAAEAYLDLGQNDMVQAYKQDVTEQLNLLVGLKKEKQQEDEIDATN